MQLGALCEKRMVTTVGVGCSPQYNILSELFMFNSVVFTEVIFLLWTLLIFGSRAGFQKLDVGQSHFSKTCLEMCRMD